jgi:GNAT superfamily N-acetyltransferase
MRTRREDGHEIDTDPERLDVVRVHEWLATDAYWARGRTEDAVRRSVAGSICYGVYAPDGAQVGFARAVSDLTTFAWICDVYVAPKSRGTGLGTWLAMTVRDHLFGLGINRLLLATADAHGVYAKAGFVPLVEPQRWMEIDRRTGGAPPPGPVT